MAWWTGPFVASVIDAQCIRKMDPAVAADMGPCPEAQPLSLVHGRVLVQESAQSIQRNSLPKKILINGDKTDISQFLGKSLLLGTD